MKKILFLTSILICTLSNYAQNMIIQKIDGSLITLQLNNIDSISFSQTSIYLPVVTTNSITFISQTFAKCESSVSNASSTGLPLRGICWSTNHNPTMSNPHNTDGYGLGNYISFITELVQNTTYYVRSYAKNSFGTVYGNEISFTTSSYGPTITDVDSNVYFTVQIGNQNWFVENLKTTRFSNGDSVPYITDTTTWKTLTTGAYCWYNNDITNKATYGALYNWYVASDSRNVCPAGWHVPSDTEWTVLINYLGGENNAGKKMKESGTSHWVAPNTGATNESGFTALPGGYRRDSNGAFYSIGSNGTWWSSTEKDINEAWNKWILNVWTNALTDDYSKKGGFSIRCIEN